MKLGKQIGNLVDDIPEIPARYKAVGVGAVAALGVVFGTAIRAQSRQGQGQGRPSHGLRLPLHDAAAPRRLLQHGQPALVDARASWPGGQGRQGDRERRHARHPPGLGLVVRPPARSVRQHRRRRRRQVELAVLLPDDAADEERQGPHRHHHQGDAGGLPLQAPRGWPRARHRPAARPSPGGVRPARPAAEEDAVRDGRKRHHPGDGDAPDHGPARNHARRRHGPLGAEQERGHLPRRDPGSSATSTRTSVSTCSTRRPTVTSR